MKRDKKYFSGLAAVSYTHLDVYKRQTSAWDMKNYQQLSHPLSMDELLRMVLSEKKPVHHRTI